MCHCSDIYLHTWKKKNLASIFFSPITQLVNVKQDNSVSEQFERQQIVQEFSFSGNSVLLTS